MSNAGEANSHEEFPRRGLLPGISGLMRRRLKFPFFAQLDAQDCGPACLRMIARYHGADYSQRQIRGATGMSRHGTTVQELAEVSRGLGLRALPIRIPVDRLVQMPLPGVVCWNANHFIVVRRVGRRRVYVADPAHGLTSYSHATFNRQWQEPDTASDGGDQSAPSGRFLALEVTPDFYRKAQESPPDKTRFRYLLHYLATHRSAVLGVALLMLLSTLLQVAAPFLTQLLVDRGIGQADLKLIHMLVLGQLLVFGGQTFSNVVRSRILLFVGTRINISIISDFLAKLMRLPLAFFDSRRTGDILQRVSDHDRIEQFLTSTVLGITFSGFQLLTFAGVLAYYSPEILLMFLVGSSLYVVWVLLFMQKRREFDHRQFEHLARNKSSLIQIIAGMHELRLNDSEERSRWEWEEIQEQLFRVNLDALKMNQYQQGGAMLITQVTNVLILFFVATSVVEGQLTLGVMMAVQFIVGQLTVPVQDVLTHARDAQEAQISLERLGEVHGRDDAACGETPPDSRSGPEDIALENVSFRYEGRNSPLVLDDISLTIPAGKVTAIVGLSGSGKSTLVKLLLKFYDATEGRVSLGGDSLEGIDSRWWRRRCGVVMQNGYLFSDTIARNICMGDEDPDPERLLHALRMANIESFVESLEQGLQTQVGPEGQGLSGGQKQRLLIARAIYKDPQYLILDEATNALDADNEKAIVENFRKLFDGRSAVIIAHRLSTVRNADQIIVLEHGKICESGTHAELIEARGSYFRLVKNQLELGT